MIGELITAVWKPVAGFIAGGGVVKVYQVFKTNKTTLTQDLISRIETLEDRLESQNTELQKLNRLVGRLEQENIQKTAQIEQLRKRLREGEDGS